MSPNSNQTQTTITGLTPQEAAARLDQFGPNEPTATQHHSLLSDFLHAFSNPLVLILVIAAIVSGFMGEAVDAGIIGVIVLLSAAIDVTQTLSFSRALWNDCAIKLLPRPACYAAGNGKRFDGVTSYLETSCGFLPGIWFLPTRASWLLVTSTSSRLHSRANPSLAKRRRPENPPRPRRSRATWFFWARPW